MMLEDIRKCKNIHDVYDTSRLQVFITLKRETYTRCAWLPSCTKLPMCANY